MGNSYSPQRHRDTEKTNDRGSRRSVAASSRSSATEITESTEGAFPGTIKLPDSLDSSPIIRRLKNTGLNGKLSDRHGDTGKGIRKTRRGNRGEIATGDLGFSLRAVICKLLAVGAEGHESLTSRYPSVSPCLSGNFRSSRAFSVCAVGKGSPTDPREFGSLMVPGNAPSVLSLTSVAEPREDAATDLRHPLSLVFSVSLCLRGEQEVTAFNQGRRRPSLGLSGKQFPEAL